MPYEGSATFSYTPPVNLATGVTGVTGSLGGCHITITAIAYPGHSQRLHRVLGAVGDRFAVGGLHRDLFRRNVQGVARHDRYVDCRQPSGPPSLLVTDSAGTSAAGVPRC